MRPTLYKAMFVGFLPSWFALAGCSADIHGNNANVDINATVTATTSVNLQSVQPGETMPIQVSVSNVTLVDPSTAPPTDVTNAAYLQFYIDTTSNQPIAVTAQTSVMVTIPPAEPPGGHKLLCQVYKHDGTPTTSMTEIDFTVAATVSVTPVMDAGGGD